jgi:hypothetical protein
MTRSEFWEQVNDWDELLDFCYDNDIYTCEDIYTDDAKNDYINDNLSEYARGVSSWQNLLDILQSVPEGDDWYILDEYGDFAVADEVDFSDRKELVSDVADNKDLWDYEEDEEEEDPPEEECEQDEALEEIETSFDELYKNEGLKLTLISQDKVNAAKEEKFEISFKELF